MSQLPTWISARIIKLLGELYQELLTQQPYGIINFSTFGLVIQNNEGQESTFTLLDLITQPGFIEDIEANNTYLLETQPPIEPIELSFDPIETSIESNFDWLNDFFVVPSQEDEFKNIIEEIKDTEFVNSDSSQEPEEKLEPIIIIPEQTNITSEKDWPTKLEEAVLKIYNQPLINNEKIVQYYKLGYIISIQPRKYRKNIHEIKRGIDDTLGKRVYEKPYNIAQKVFDIYQSEEEALANKFEFTPSKLFHLKREEIFKIIA